MMSIRKALALFLCSVCLLLQGCTAWQVNQLASSLSTLGPEHTLAQLEKIVPPSRDKAQYLLNRGLLKLYTGDLTGSREDLAQAKDIMSSLQAVSLTENFAALTTNETLRSYTGSPSDKVLVHVMLALGYLMDGDMDGARVEMLQANITMKQESDGETESGQMASARFIAGMIFELQREYDDAYISYERAYNILQARGEHIPEALQTSLLYLAKRQGRKQEYRSFVKQFGHEAPVIGKGLGEWFVIYHDGVVSKKSETRLSVFDAGVDTMVSVVMPHYYPSNYSPNHLLIQSGTKKADTEIIEYLEKRIREDLEKNKAKELAAATVRAVAKYKMVQEAQSKGDFGGIIMNIATVASEQADVRSWNMLPASIQLARITVPLDEPLQIVNKAQTLPPLSEVTKGSYGVVLVNSLNQRVYQYPPAPSLAQVEVKGETHVPETAQ